MSPASSDSSPSPGSVSLIPVNALSPGTFAPFWFLNDTLTENEIRWQIQQMHAAGIRGFLPSPRQGLTLPYLSDSFFKIIQIAIDEAKKLGLAVHLYDELPYPSGTAGGEVLLGNPHFHATELIQKTFDVDSSHEIRLEFPRGKILNCTAYPLIDNQPDWSSPTCLESAIGVVLTEDSYQQVGLTPYNRKRYFANVATPTLLTCLPGPHRIIVSVQKTVEDHKYFFHFIDVLNPQAIQHFIRLTHDRYCKCFGPESGNTVQSIFTDETTPVWSERLPAEFQARIGYDLLPLLPALHDPAHPHHAKTKFDFHRIKHDLFVESFEKPVADWCRNHRIQYWGEKPLLRLSQWQYSDIPGCDAAHVKAGAPPDLVSSQLRANPRAAASAAYFYGKPAAACECFHSLGWGTTLQDLKWLTDGLLLHGINRFIPHAFFYSTHNLRKHDAPPSLFFQMPWWPLFNQLVQYTEKILKHFGQTHIDAKVLILDPTPGVPADSQLAAFVHLQNLLLEMHVDYLIVDSQILFTATVDQNLLKIKELEIELVILPPLLYIEPELKIWLDWFTAQGGRAVYFDSQFDAGILPAPSLSMTAVEGDLQQVHMVTRRDESRTLWFLQNTASFPVTLELPAGLVEVDGPSQFRPHSATTVRRSLDAYESILLVRSPLIETAQPRFMLPLPTEFSLHPHNENLLPLLKWQMTLHTVKGPDQSATVLPAPVLHQLNENLFQFKPHVQRAFGSVAHLSLPMLHLNYQINFENNFTGTVHLVVEPGSIRGDWQIKVNSSTLPPLIPQLFGPLNPVDMHIRGSLGADITALLSPGQNTITVELSTDRVDGGLLNCLYLAGNFGVTLQPPGLCPRATQGPVGSWEQNKLPFYAGIIDYKTAIHLAEKPTAPMLIELPLDPRFLNDDAFEISFNNGCWHPCAWSPHLIRTGPDELHAGENQLTLRLYTTLLRAFESQRFDLATHQTVDIIPNLA